LGSKHALKEKPIVYNQLFAIKIAIYNYNRRKWLVVNDSFTFNDGWGTQKDCLIFYSMDPSFDDMLLKLNDTFILNVWFYS